MFVIKLPNAVVACPVNLMPSIEPLLNCDLYRHVSCTDYHTYNTSLETPNIEYNINSKSNKCLSVCLSYFSKSFSKK